jgi:predicted ferric reductase
VFEIFYYAHIAFAAGMAACAFYHSGKLVPILVSLTWGVDLVVRKLIMATTRYPRKAKLESSATLSSSSDFLKPKVLTTTLAGQFVFIAVLELGLLDWHPFSISSSPGQKVVTIHIQKVGGWTSALHDLVQTKEDISILIEGPFGNIGVDLSSNRYHSMIMLASGGIGITPMQSICNQLIHEHSASKQTLQKLSFVWMERDPLVMSDVDVVRRSSDIHRLSSRKSPYFDNGQSCADRYCVNYIVSCQACWFDLGCCW